MSMLQEIRRSLTLEDRSKWFDTRSPGPASTFLLTRVDVLINPAFITTMLTQRGSVLGSSVKILGVR